MPKWQFSAENTITKFVKVTLVFGSFPHLHFLITAIDFVVAANCAGCC